MKDYWSLRWLLHFKSLRLILHIQPFSKKAARLGYCLIMNHPFIDGNKRIGTHAMLTFLAINGIEISCTQKELSDIILDVAAGKTSYDDLLNWLLNHQE